MRPGNDPEASAEEHAGQVTDQATPPGQRDDARLLVLRVWMPDRPGALGEVAGSLGSVGADVVGIEILEQGAGSAIDELVVALPAGLSVEKLVAAIRASEGAEVEDVHPADRSILEPDLHTLEAAVELLAAKSVDQLVEGLVAHVAVSLRATWAVVIDTEQHLLLGAHGEAPLPKWLVAFLHGSATSAAVHDGTAAPPDLAWARLPSGGLAAVVGRDGVPFRQRERRRLAALAAVADARLAHLV